LRCAIVRPSEPAQQVDICIVVDVLRATTTAAVLCEQNGELYVVRTPGELAQLPERAGGYALFSELADIASDIPRFDNSPVQARETALAGRMPVLVTTNGTLAVALAAERAPCVLLAGFVNLGAIVAYVAQAGAASVGVMPAGHVRKAQRHAEDEGCAESLVARLAGDALDVAGVIARCRVDARIVERRAREPHLDADIALCFDLDAVPVVPRVRAADAGWFHVTRG
jgi:phosphosulfolactate phosphohydrolase-like enzyme